MDSEVINNTLEKISETEKNLDKLCQKQTYLESMLDTLLNVKKEVILAKSLNSKRVLLAQCRCCFIVACSWNIFSPSGLFLCALDTVYEH